jgi:hypothetical protein
MDGCLSAGRFIHGRRSARQQLQAHGGEEDEHARRHRAVAELGHEAEREHQRVQEHELLDVRAVGERDRRVADPLADAGDVVERDQQRGERDGGLARQGAGGDVAVHEARQLAHHAVGVVRARLAARAAQVGGQRGRVLAEERRVAGAPAGAVLEHRVQLVRQRARHVEQLPPRAAPLPPPVVGGVRAEHQQQAEDDAEDREHGRPERHRGVQQVELRPRHQRGPEAGQQHVDPERPEHRAAREVDEDPEPVLRVVRDHGAGS